MSIPSTRIEFEKNNDNTLVKGLGWNFQSPSNPAALYEFMSTIYSIFFEKIKTIKKFTGYKKFNIG